jgi:hypothetical protein
MTKKPSQEEKLPRRVECLRLYCKQFSFEPRHTSRPDNCTFSAQPAASRRLARAYLMQGQQRARLVTIYCPHRWPDDSGWRDKRIYALTHSAEHTERRQMPCNFDPNRAI